MVSQDEIRLARMGYRQEFERGFTFLHNFGISLSHITVIGGIGALYTFVLGYGGPAGAVWGWIAVSFLSLAVGASMAEICSSYPTAGGLYYWSSKLGGAEYGPAFAWFTGWFNLVGDVASCAAGANAVAQCIFSIAVVYQPDFAMPNWKFGLLGIMVLLSHAIINASHPLAIKRALEISVGIHTIGLVVMVIVVLAMTPNHPSASFVFTEVLNVYSGQSNQGFSILLSLLMPAWCFVGYDASAHVAEETKDSFRQASRGIIYSIVVSAIGGLAMILAFSFSIVDLDAVLFSTNPAPLMQLFLDSTGGNQQVAVFLMVIIVAANYFAGLSAMCANSRMIYAFSRDKAFGEAFSRFLYQTSPRTRLPTKTIFFSATLASCICAIGFGSSIGLQVAASIGTIGMMTAYGLPIFCRLTFAKSTFKKGEFTLGMFSEIIGWISVVWIAFLFVLLCLPYNYPVTGINFNYASVLIGSLTFLTGAAWIFSARAWFTGPVPHVTEAEVEAMERALVNKKEDLGDEA